MVRRRKDNDLPYASRRPWRLDFEKAREEEGGFLPLGRDPSDRVIFQRVGGKRELLESSVAAHQCSPSGGIG